MFKKKGKEKLNQDNISRSANLIFFITPTTLTSLIAHFSIILLLLFEIVFPAANTFKAIDSYVSSGTAISAAIAVIITTVITHIFNPKYTFKLHKFRNIILFFASFIIVILGLINLLMINFSIDSNLIKVNSLNTYFISVIVCILAIIVTYYSFAINYEPDAAKAYILKTNEAQKKFQASVDQTEEEDKYSDD